MMTFHNVQEGYCNTLDQYHFISAPRRRPGPADLARLTVKIIILLMDMLMSIIVLRPQGTLSKLHLWMGSFGVGWARLTGADQDGIFGYVSGLWVHIRTRV